MLMHDQLIGDRTMKERFAWMAAVAAAASLAAGGASAQSTPIETPRLVSDQVSIVNSGAGMDEVDKVKRLSPGYPLRVILSGRDGDYYIADRFTLSRRGEVVAEVPQAGPWLLIDLPNGSYEMQAEFGDRSLRRTVHVARGGTTVHWVVPTTID